MSRAFRRDGPVIDIHCHRDCAPVAEFMKDAALAAGKVALGHGNPTTRAVNRRQLEAIPRSPGRLPPVRVAEAAPAAELRSYYEAAQRRFGIPWSILASINFVESAFAAVIPTLQAKQCDVIMAQLYIKPEREKVVDFVPYVVEDSG